MKLKMIHGLEDSLPNKNGIIYGFSHSSCQIILFIYLVLRTYQLIYLSICLFHIYIRVDNSRLV